MLRRKTQIAIGAALLAAAAAFAPAAHAERVGFNVSIGGPGYGVSFGNGPYWRGSHYYRPYWSAAYLAPPVVYSAPVVGDPSTTGTEARPWPAGAPAWPAP
jgi:hypothetical protein